DRRARPGHPPQGTIHEPTCLTLRSRRHPPLTGTAPHVPASACPICVMATAAWQSVHQDVEAFATLHTSLRAAEDPAAGTRTTGQLLSAAEALQPAVRATRNLPAPTLLDVRSELREPAARTYAA